MRRKRLRHLPQWPSTLLNDYLAEMALARFNHAIADGFVEIPFGKIAELEDGKRIPLNKRQRELRKGPFRYYGAASVMDYVDDYLFDGVRLLIGEDGTVMNDAGFASLQYVWGKYWVNNHAHIARGNNGYSTEDIYLAMMQTPVNEIVTGAVQPKINQKNLNSLILKLPKERVDLSSVFALMRVNHDEGEQLASLRDALLPKLMSDQLDVRAIEI